MTRFIGIILVTGMLASGLARLWSDEAAKPKDAKAAEKDIDILKDVVEWNSAKFTAPPTQFREGHCKPLKLDDKALKKADNGFTVSLPSGAPIPTPTIYQGKIYVSGGFHSKEYYCLKADMGELVWGATLDDDGPSAAVAEDDVVVFNTESCTIFALDAKTGKQLWSHWLGDPLTSTPTIANGKVFTSYRAVPSASRYNRPHVEEQRSLFGGDAMLSILGSDVRLCDGITRREALRIGGLGFMSGRV